MSINTSSKLLSTRAISRWLTWSVPQRHVQGIRCEDLQESNVFKFVDKSMTRFRCQLRLCMKNRGHGCENISVLSTQAKLLTSIPSATQFVSVASGRPSNRTASGQFASAVYAFERTPGGQSATTRPTRLHCCGSCGAEARSRGGHRCANHWTAVDPAVRT